LEIRANQVPDPVFGLCGMVNSFLMTGTDTGTA
jgi:hypothetical protein